MGWMLLAKETVVVAGGLQAGFVAPPPPPPPLPAHAVSRQVIASKAISAAPSVRIPSSSGRPLSVGPDARS